jgi:hypothetical protein
MIRSWSLSISLSRMVSGKSATFRDQDLAKVPAARNRAERHDCSFAMPVRRRCCVVPMAMSRPVMSSSAMMTSMSSPTVPARVMAAVAMAQILVGGGRDRGIGGLSRPFVLAARITAVARDTMAARHWAEQGQALIIGVRRLNFFAIVDAAGSGFGTSRGRDQDGGKDTVQDKSQGFIL